MERELEFDILKGIGILLVIIGHFSPLPYGSTIINMFHIPLFFIVSGYFFKHKCLVQVINSNLKLLLYYATTSTAIVLFTYFYSGYSIAVCQMKMFLFGKPSSLFDFGPLWFLLTMFWTKIIYNEISKIGNNVLIFIILTLLVTILFIVSKANDCTHFPFFILQAIPAMWFYHIGVIFRNINMQTIKDSLFPILVILYAILSFIELQSSEFNFSCLRFSVFPLSFINAIIASFILYRFCIYLKTRFEICQATKFLANCGNVSLLILVFHGFDFSVLRPIIRNTDIYTGFLWGGGYFFYLV